MSACSSASRAASEGIGRGSMLAVERRDLPATLAVAGVHARQALDGELGADAARALDLAHHERLAPVRRPRLAGHAQRLDPFDPLGASAGREVPGHDLVQRLRRAGRGQEARHDEECSSSSHQLLGLGRAAGRDGPLTGCEGHTTGPGTPPPPQRDAVLGRLGGGRLGLRGSRFGLASAVLGLPHARLRLDLAPVGLRLRRLLAQDRVTLGRRHPLAVELDVAARPVALLLRHPATADRHAAERLVRLRIVGQHRQHPRVRLACLRRETLVGGPAAEREPAGGVRRGERPARS